MKAAQINEYGDSSVIQINEIEKPVLKDNQVLVKVHAASINPFDTSLRRGHLKERIPLKFPATLGGDISGIIVEIGSDAVGFAVGDKVYGQAAIVAGNSGAFAEFAATSAKQVAKMPNRLDFNQAASIVLVGVSAYQGIVEELNVQSGEKLFIHGGGGGIGAIAIQIAKNIGAYVAATASSDSIEYVKSLGADKIIDYKSQDFSQVLKDYDAVFDTVGGDDTNKSLHILKSGGRAVSMAGRPDDKLASELSVSASSQATRVNTQRLDKLSVLVESGVVKPHVGQIFELENIKEAFDAIESGKLKGKAVIKIS